MAPGGYGFGAGVLLVGRDRSHVQFLELTRGCAQSARTPSFRIGSDGSFRFSGRLLNTAGTITLRGHFRTPQEAALKIVLHRVGCPRTLLTVTAHALFNVEPRPPTG